jgi:O-methyltransferase involved in polyketide biosynthesis
MKRGAMTEKFAVELGNVQRTMFLPLWGRAYESKKEKPLLVDKTALAIIEAVDFDFSTIAKNISGLSQAAWIMRSLYVDDAVRAFLAAYPGATVVNIGCGMDTTFDRVDDGALLWYDLDLPDVIRLRRQFIPETERRRTITASFLDEGWLREISVLQNVLFIAAGVFYYFDEKDVRGFLVRLADRFPGSEIVFDVSSPYGVKVANRMVIQNSGLDERSFLIWGLKDPKTILSWDPRFRLVSVDYYFGARGRSLDLGTRLFGMLSDLLKIQYMLHLKMLD